MQQKNQPAVSVNLSIKSINLKKLLFACWRAQSCAHLCRWPPQPAWSVPPVRGGACDHTLHLQPTTCACGCAPILCMMTHNATETLSPLSHTEAESWGRQVEETTLNGSTMISRTPREEKKSWVRKNDMKLFHFEEIWSLSWTSG